jgi:hypothetical protein
MSNEIVRFSAPLIHWELGDFAGLGYVSITGAADEAIKGYELMRRLELGKRRGFGSVKVNVTLGDSRWSTSVFPSKETGGWFLPIKKAVQRAEGLNEGDLLDIELDLL